MVSTGMKMSSTPTANRCASTVKTQIKEKNNGKRDIKKGPQGSGHDTTADGR